MASGICCREFICFCSLNTLSPEVYNTEWLNGYELERIWKEGVIAYFKIQDSAKVAL